MGVTKDGKMDDIFEVLEAIAYWARKYPELYEPGAARNTIANHLSGLFKKLDELKLKKYNN